MGWNIKKGATQLIIFQGTLKATNFCTITEHGLLPFIRQHFTDGDYHFQQDNDPKHTSGLAQSFLEDHDVNWWRTPAESPDLNPIENIWGSLKYFLRTHYKPTNLETLVEGITGVLEDINTNSVYQIYFSSSQSDAQSCRR